jgi:peptide methionine sulfoxide reductase msrA/msrB
MKVRSSLTVLTGLFLPVLLLVACRAGAGSTAKAAPNALAVPPGCDQKAFFREKHDQGVYVHNVTGEVLFSSLQRIDSGGGWPSFTALVTPQAAQQIEPPQGGKGKPGRVRAALRTAKNAPLGVVLNDGPADAGGTRYCVNPASLRFIPAARLAAEGYASFAAQFPFTPQEGVPMTSTKTETATTTETAILAGGCFWGMEDILMGAPGVIDIEAGYTGGWLENPKYDDTHDSKSGHAEAIKVIFDPSKITYAQILDDWFFRMHDPTTLHRQGNDVGTQYRSAIFFTSPEQQKIAEEAKQRAGASGRWKKPIVTEVVAASKWWPAESYHQDYLKKNPGGYTCHFMRD